MLSPKYLFALTVFAGSSTEVAAVNNQLLALRSSNAMMAHQGTAPDPKDDSTDVQAAVAAVATAVTGLTHANVKDNYFGSNAHATSGHDLHSVVGGTNAGPTVEDNLKTDIKNLNAAITAAGTACDIIVTTNPATMTGTADSHDTGSTDAECGTALTLFADAAIDHTAVAACWVDNGSTTGPPVASSHTCDHLITAVNNANTDKATMQSKHDDLATAIASGANSVCAVSAAVVVGLGALLF